MTPSMADKFSANKSTVEIECAIMSVADNVCIVASFIDALSAKRSVTDKLVITLSTADKFSANKSVVEIEWAIMSVADKVCIVASFIDALFANRSVTDKLVITP